MTILSRLGVSPKKLLGKGGEGEVYEMDTKSVVKIHGGSSREYLESLQKFQESLQKHKFSFETSQIIKISKIEGKWVTLEKRLRGISGEKVFERLKEADRKKLLVNLLKASEEISLVNFPTSDYGEILYSPNRINSNDWPDFLIKKLGEKSRNTRKALSRDVSDFEQKYKTLEQALTKLSNIPKKLVHADYYLNNVLVDENLKISAVLDFSKHAVVGDWRMDIAGAVCFLGVDVHARNYIKFMRSLVSIKYGEEMLSLVDLYTLYYSIYYSDVYGFDPNSYTWCIGNLNNETLWRDMVKSHA